MYDDDRLSEVMPALLRPGGLQALVEAALRRTLAADPHDTDAQWKLAGVHRRQGSFAAAREAVRELCAPAGLAAPLPPRVQSRRGPTAGGPSW